MFNTLALEEALPDTIIPPLPAEPPFPPLPVAVPPLLFEPDATTDPPEPPFPPWLPAAVLPPVDERAEVVLVMQPPFLVIIEIPFPKDRGDGEVLPAQAHAHPDGGGGMRSNAAQMGTILFANEAPGPPNSEWNASREAIGEEIIRPVCTSSVRESSLLGKSLIEFVDAINELPISYNLRKYDSYGCNSSGLLKWSSQEESVTS